MSTFNNDARIAQEEDEGDYTLLKENPQSSDLKTIDYFWDQTERASRNPQKFKSLSTGQFHSSGTVSDSFSTPTLSRGASVKNSRQNI